MHGFDAVERGSPSEAWRQNAVGFISQGLHVLDIRYVLTQLCFMDI